MNIKKGTKDMLSFLFLCNINVFRYFVFYTFALIIALILSLTRIISSAE